MSSRVLTALVPGPQTIFQTCLGLLLCWSSLTLADARRVKSAHYLRVATFNVNHLFNLVNRTPDGRLKYLPIDEDIVAQKAEMILQTDADIVILPETESKEALADFNARYLKNQFVALRLEGNSRRQVEIGLLIRRELTRGAKLISHRRMLFPDPVTGRQELLWSRDVPTLILPSDQPGRPSLVLGSVHLQSPSRKSKEERSKFAAQERGLVEIYEGLRNEYGADVPVMFGGDYNSDLLDRTELPLLRQHMLEVFDRSPRPRSRSQRSTYQLFNRSGELLMRLQIDGFFVSPSLAHAIHDAFTVPFTNCEGELVVIKTRDDRKQVASDHNPVVVDLYLPRPLQRARP